MALKLPRGEFDGLSESAENTEYLKVVWEENGQLMEAGRLERERKLGSQGNNS